MCERFFCFSISQKRERRSRKRSRLDWITAFCVHQPADLFVAAFVCLYRPDLSLSLCRLLYLLFRLRESLYVLCVCVCALWARRHKVPLSFKRRSPLFILLFSPFLMSSRIWLFRLLYARPTLDTHTAPRGAISLRHISRSLGLSSNSRLGFKRIHLYDIVVVLGPHTRAAAPAARIDRLHKQSSNPMKLYTVPCCCCCCCCCCFPSRF
jgi:hypothetical protein